MNKSAILWETFSAEYEPPVLGHCRRRENLLDHAKLFVFADEYIVTELKPVCLDRMYDVLVEYKLSEKTVSHLMDMIRYVYANTAHTDSDGADSELRTLIKRYVVAKLEVLAKYSDFVLFVRNDGAFSSELLLSLAKPLPVLQP